MNLRMVLQYAICGTLLTCLHAVTAVELTSPCNMVWTAKRGGGGGLVIQRHNEVRDYLGDISSEVWPSVIKEPIVMEADPSSNDVGLRLIWEFEECGHHRQRRCLTFA